MGLTDQFDTMSIVVIVALAGFSLGALVQSGVGTIGVLGYTLGDQVMSFAMPVIDSTAVITYANLLSILGLLAIATEQGFDQGTWEGWSTPEKVFAGGTFAIVFLPIFFPSVSGLVHYNQLTEVVAFIVSTGGAYVLGRTEYSGNALKMS